MGSILWKIIIKSQLTLNIQSLHRNFLCSNFFYITVFEMNNIFMFSKVKMIKFMLRSLASAHTCHFYSCLHLRGKFLSITNVSLKFMQRLVNRNAYSYFLSLLHSYYSILQYCRLFYTFSFALIFETLHNLFLLHHC